MNAFWFVSITAYCSLLCAVVCQRCQNTSSVFDPFLDISLDIRVCQCLFGWSVHELFRFPLSLFEHAMTQTIVRILCTLYCTCRTCRMPTRWSRHSRSSPHLRRSRAPTRTSANAASASCRRSSDSPFTGRPLCLRCISNGACFLAFAGAPFTLNAYCLIQRTVTTV